MKIVSKALRNSARGQDCTLRIPGVCNFNPETTVLAHLPCGHKGMGMKSPDNMAVFAFSNCHDFIDQRSGKSKADIDAWDLLRALAETHSIMISEELIKIKGFNIK